MAPKDATQPQTMDETFKSLEKRQNRSLATGR